MQTSVFRLSVVVTPGAGGPLPLPNRRALAERCIGSVLQQTDPIGTEVVVALQGTRADQKSETLDYLRTAFPDEAASGRLQLLELERIGDLGKLRNEAAARAQGMFLAFLDLEDWWKPGRLVHLEPLLQRHDLILATNDPVVESSDWIQTFVTTNVAVRSSAVVRRSLFEEVGGYPLGLTGLPLPRRLPGVADYEFHLRCLLALIDSGRKDRFALIQNADVNVEKPILPEKLGDIQTRVELVREAITLLQVSRALPRRYWPALVKRIRETGKTVFKKTR